MRLQKSYREFDSHTRLQFYPIQLQRVVRAVVFGELLRKARLIPILIPAGFREQRQTWTTRSELRRESSTCHYRNASIFLLNSGGGKVWERSTGIKKPVYGGVAAAIPYRLIIAVILLVLVGVPLKANAQTETL